jgi:hypothetical protein
VTTVMTSPPSSEESENLYTSSPTEDLAFVVHSQDTVQNNLPPDVDNKNLARQKRRRTRYASNSRSLFYFTAIFDAFFAYIKTCGRALY